eukprot:scaffold22095_cov71-Attheya_sp.AAC.3
MIVSALGAVIRLVTSMVHGLFAPISSPVRSPISPNASPSFIVVMGVVSSMKRGKREEQDEDYYPLPDYAAMDASGYEVYDKSSIDPVGQGHGEIPMLIGAHECLNDPERSPPFLEMTREEQDKDYHLPDYAAIDAAY